MAEYNVTIVDGKASVDLPVGNYTVSAVTVDGYDLTSFTPTSMTVTETTTDFSYTIAAEGSITLHVSIDGLPGGTAVTDAVFMRCDKDGNTIAGSEQTTSTLGRITFDNTPYGDPTSKIYIKNTVASIGHALIDDILEFSPTTNSETYEVATPLLYTQAIDLTDANYSGLNIENATIKIESQI